MAILVNSAPPADLQPWRAPVVRVFGGVVELTAGGSGYKVPRA